MSNQYLFFVLFLVINIGFWMLVDNAQESRCSEMYLTCVENSVHFEIGRSTVNLRMGNSLKKHYVDFFSIFKDSH